MEERFFKALAAAARAFADTWELEELAEQLSVDEAAERASRGLSVLPGSAESMEIILRRFAEENDRLGRGLTQAEASAIAREGRIDPRGLAGYFAPGSGLLASRDDGRWITAVGRERLGELQTILAS